MKPQDKGNPGPMMAARRLPDTSCTAQTVRWAVFCDTIRKEEETV